jgi:CRISPR/Cas system-associated exonuclease Cas4 (RecB family)
MVRLSYSKISDYENCPRKYWLTYVKEVPIQPNKYLKIGREIHEILYNSTLYKDWRRYLLTHPKYKEYQTMIDNYVSYQEKIVDAGGNPVPELAEMKYREEDLDFSWIIDRIDSFKGRKLLCDYKSDAIADNNKHDKQLLIYTYFYNKRYPEAPITHYAPFFIKTRKSIKAKEVTKEKLDEIYEWFINMKKEIESKGEDYKEFPTKPSKLCEWCSHATTGVCKVGIKHIEENNKIVEMGENNELDANIS